MNIFQRIKKTPKPHTPDVSSSYTPMAAAIEAEKAILAYPRLSVNMSDETARKIKWLMEELHTSATDVVGQAIYTLEFLLQEQQKGNIQIRYRRYTQTYDVGIKR